MNTYSGNQPFLKELNIKSALRVIRSKGMISRAALADTLGLNRSTITAISKQLIAENLVREIGIGPSKGGRPPKLLQFNSEAGYTVSLSWSPQNVQIFINDLKGEIFYAQKMSYDPSKDSASQISTIVAEIKSAWTNIPQKPLGFLGICISVPGIIDRYSVSSYDLQWDQVPLYDYFRKHFDLPIIIEHTANIGLTAEQYFGCAIGFDNVCYVQIDHGISAAFLYQGNLYRGHEGFAGYVGHSVIDIHGKPCICGRNGCWQQYASEDAILKRYQELKNNPSEVTESDFKEKVKAHDSSAIQALNEFSEYVGLGLSNLINTLNPSLVVIKSSFNDLGPLILEPVKLTIKNNALPYPRRNVSILFSSLEEKAVIFGSTAFILDRFLETPKIAW